jgi:hypothetical protein
MFLVDEGSREHNLPLPPSMGGARDAWSWEVPTHYMGGGDTWAWEAATLLESSMTAT